MAALEGERPRPLIHFLPIVAGKAHHFPLKRNVLTDTTTVETPEDSNFNCEPGVFGLPFHQATHGARTWWSHSEYTGSTLPRPCPRISCVRFPACRTDSESFSLPHLLGPVVGLVVVRQAGPSFLRQPSPLLPNESVSVAAEAMRNADHPVGFHRLFVVAGQTFFDHFSPPPNHLKISG